MNLNLECKESIIELITYLEKLNYNEYDNSDIAHFESKDTKTNKLVLLTLYKKPDPVKLSINVKSDEETGKDYALFDKYGNRIENLIEGEY